MAFKKNIREWSSEFRIAQVALKKLITILNEHLNLNIQSDPRTIMRTPRTIDVIPMAENGKYWHNGFEKSIRNSFSQIDRSMLISININVDGLPINKSSENHFWPILFNVHEFPQIGAMTIGIFCGNGKPKLAKEYLAPFINEIIPILENGIYINGHKIDIVIRSFICDSPARAFVKGNLINSSI